MLSITLMLASGPTVVTVDPASTAAAKTAAIQSALDQAAAAGGGRVTLSAGTWDVAGTGKAADGCLRIGSNVILEGAGNGLTVIKLADGASGVTGIIRTDSGATKPDGSFTTVTKVTIRDLTIDGNRANTTGSTDGFYCGPKPNTAQADQTITLDRVEVMNCSRYGIDPHERSYNLLFRDCVAHSNGVDGFTIDFSIGVRFENCVAWGNGRHGFNLVTSTADVVLVDCIARDNGGSGLIIQTGDNEVRAFTRDITVKGGSFTGNGRAGIEAKQANDIQVDGATIKENTRWGILLGGVSNVDIANTSIEGNGGTVPIRVLGHVQTFSDSDPLNDRWIASSAVTRDGVAVAAPDNQNTGGLPVWSLFVTDGADTLIGSTSTDTIAAGSGNDFVLGLDGNDVLFGEDGRDTLDGGLGTDTLQGGAGNDLLRVWSATARDVLDGGAGIDTADFLRVGVGIMVDLRSVTPEVTTGSTVLATLTSIENINGSALADRITGSDGANTLFGSGGNDTIDGAGGDDVIIGGRGNDVLTGGAGSDAFRFLTNNGMDVIMDYAVGVDRLEFRGVAASAVGVAAGDLGAEITYGSSIVTLLGVDAALLTAADFRYL